MLLARLGVGVVLALAGPGLAGLAGCARHTTVELKGTSGSSIGRPDRPLLPATVLGLDVSPEDVGKTIAGARRADVDELALNGFRKDNLLEATLQYARFNARSKATGEKFQFTVASEVGTATPLPVTVGDALVYQTLGSRQRVYVWFRGRAMYILVVREDFPTPRALLRTILELTR